MILPFSFATGDYNADNSRHCDTARHSQHGSDHSTELLSWGRGSCRWPVRRRLYIPLFEHVVNEVGLVQKEAEILAKILSVGLPYGDYVLRITKLTSLKLTPSTKCGANSFHPGNILPDKIFLLQGMQCIIVNGMEIDDWSERKKMS